MTRAIAEGGRETANLVREVGAHIDRGVEFSIGQETQIAIAISDQVLTRREQTCPRLASVQDRHCMTMGEGSFNNVSSNEARATNYEDLHNYPFMSPISHVHHDAQNSRA
jgi:hypothetical protein